MTHEEIVDLTAQAWGTAKAKGDPDFAGVNPSFQDALIANTAALADGRPGSSNMAVMNTAVSELLAPHTAPVAEVSKSKKAKE